MLVILPHGLLAMTIVSKLHVQRGVYDLNTFFGEGNAWRLVPNYFGLPMGTKIKEILARESPLTYVENIKTPFIIFTEATIAVQDRSR
jgi:hypothetical protein